MLAKASLTVAVPARGAAQVTVPEDVAAFGDAAAELIAAVSDGEGFAPAFRYGAEVVDQRLDSAPLRVEAERDGDAVLLHLTATSLARDVFCHADIADPGAAAEQGMITLRAGETATIRVHSPAGDPDAFAATLRCANDLL